jgi:hypothetical protein
VNNWQRVTALADECTSLGWPVLLHALDSPHPALASWTRSVGPGNRFENLNRLLPHVDPTRWTVVSDDDVVLPRRGIESLVAICCRMGFDIAQPAHRVDSYYSHVFTRRWPGLVARVTGFVEIGPMVVFSPAIWPLVSPFPEEGMGWGTDVEWSNLRSVGMRLGIIDAIPLVHLSPPGMNYDVAAEVERLEKVLQSSGLTSVQDLHYTDRIYPFWSMGFSPAYYWHRTN